MDTPMILPLKFTRTPKCLPYLLLLLRSEEPRLFHAMCHGVATKALVQRQGQLLRMVRLGTIWNPKWWTWRRT
eukprot:symbB.v1.2.029647.t1/scaffold3219.1/size60888/6